VTAVPGRNRRAVITGAATAGTILAMLLSGCHGNSGNGAAPAGTVTPRPTHDPTTSGRPSTTSSIPTNSTCPGEAPQTLLTAIDHQWSRQPGDPHMTIPFQGSSHGDHVVVEVLQGKQSLIGMEDLASRQITPIRHVANESVEVDGTWDGTTAVWLQYTNPQYTQFTAWSWTPGHAPRQLGGSIPSAAEAGYTAPIDWPTISGAHAAWIRASGPGGQTQLIQADLATGQTQIIAQGHLSDPLYYDGLLIWGQGFHPGALYGAEAVDPSTGARKQPPPALASEKGGYAFVASGTSVAFLNTDAGGQAGRVVYFSPDPQQPARVALTMSGAGAGLGWPLGLDGSLISGVGHGKHGLYGGWVIDGATGSSYFIPQTGILTANASDLVFTPERLTPGVEKGVQHPLGNNAVLPLRDVPAPSACH
jgi:hypothetical protein